MIAVALFGWVMIFKADRMAARHKRNSRGGIVLKPWYPTYLRCQGIFLWIFVACMLYAVVFLHLR